VTRRALTLLLAVAAAVGAGAAGAVAWFSTGSNATIAVTAYSPPALPSLASLVSLHSQTTAPAPVLPNYAFQYRQNAFTTTLAASGSNAGLTLDLGRKDGSWPPYARVFTVHVSAAAPGPVTIAIATQAVTAPAGTPTSVLTSRLALITAGVAGTPAASVTVPPGGIAQVNLQPSTTARDEYRATVRISPTAANVLPMTPVDVPVAWCHRPGNSDGCAA
jgi:hypothetical protein